MPQKIDDKKNFLELLLRQPQGPARVSNNEGLALKLLNSTQHESTKRSTSFKPFSSHLENRPCARHFKHFPTPGKSTKSITGIGHPLFPAFRSGRLFFSSFYCLSHSTMLSLSGNFYCFTLSRAPHELIELKLSCTENFCNISTVDKWRWISMCVPSKSQWFSAITVADELGVFGDELRGKLDKNQSFCLGFN